MKKYIHNFKKSVKSINPCQSVIQTIYDIVKAHGGLISVFSEINYFIEFSLKLPIKGPEK